MVTGDKEFITEGSIRLCNHCGLPRRWAVNPPQIGGEGMQPLYCFMLDDNYKLHKWVVEDYRYTPSTGWGGKPYYSFTANGNLYHVKEQDLDIFKHGKYVSFTDNKQAAVKAITTAYIVKLEKAEANCRRLASIVNKIKEQGL